MIETEKATEVRWGIRLLHFSYKRILVGGRASERAVYLIIFISDIRLCSLINRCTKQVFWRRHARLGWHVDLRRNATEILFRWKFWCETKFCWKLFWLKTIYSKSRVMLKISCWCRFVDYSWCLIISRDNFRRMYVWNLFGCFISVPSTW